MYARELCAGCLEMFCKPCAEAHNLCGATYNDPPLCGRVYTDHLDVVCGRQDLFVPGWKAALVRKHVPSAVMGSYCVHTAGWHLQFFLNMRDPDAAMIHRETMEEICEALRAAWTAWPVSAVKAHYDTAEIPEEAEGGIMVTLESVRL
jgi:hypothetical protein